MVITGKMPSLAGLKLHPMGMPLLRSHGILIRASAELYLQAGSYVSRPPSKHRSPHYITEWQSHDQSCLAGTHGSSMQFGSISSQASLQREVSRRFVINAGLALPRHPRKIYP